MTDFIDLLILLYIKSFKNSFSILELTKLLNMSIQQIEERIDSFLENKLIQKSKSCSFELTSEGNNFLKANEMEKVDLQELLSMEEVPAKSSDTIYIPIDFHKKFDGYK